MLAAVEAGNCCSFEAAIILLARSWHEKFYREILRYWRDLDDLTGEALLVLATGIGTPDSQITAPSWKRSIVVSSVVTSYREDGRANNSRSPSKEYRVSYEQLLKLAGYSPSTPERPIGRSRERFRPEEVDSHGTRAILKAFRITESQLPVLLVIDYNESADFLFELGESVSPVALIREISIERESAKYKYESKKRFAERPLRRELDRLRNKSDGPSNVHVYNRPGQLEAVLAAMRELEMEADNATKEAIARVSRFVVGTDADHTSLADWQSLIDSAAAGGSTRRIRQLPIKLAKVIAKRLSGKPYEKNNVPQLPADELMRLRDEVASRRSSRLAEIKSLERELRALKSQDHSEYDYRRFRRVVYEVADKLGFYLDSDVIGGWQWYDGKQKNMSRTRFYAISLADSPSLTFDVALSFSSQQRDYVEEVADLLEGRGVSCFYDSARQAQLWGKDLYQYLDDVYRCRARFCVMFISRDYAGSRWTNHERRSAQARAFQENYEYILPVRFDRTKLPGVLPTVGYIDANKTCPADLVNLIQEKLEGCNQLQTMKTPTAQHLGNRLGDK
jgi:hypothetical protein